MRVVFYVRHFPPNSKPIKDPISKVVYGLAKGMVSHGADVTILCEGSVSSIYEAGFGFIVRCFENPIEKTNIRNLYRIVNFVVSAELTKYIGTLGQRDLVILNGMFHPSNFIISRILGKKRIPYILIPHGTYYPALFSKNPHFKWPYWYFFERYTLNGAAAISVYDRQHIQWLRNRRIYTRTYVMPNGFDPEEVPSDLQLTWPKCETVRLFFFGRIDRHQKGLDMLLEAITQVDTEIHLTLQGVDWGDLKKLKEQSRRLGLSKKVAFLEPDFKTDPLEIMMRYHIFCQPSRYEGFSLSLLEAMLAGRVLLVSCNDGGASYVETSGCGVVVKPNVIHIVDALKALIKSRHKWRKMGLAGRNHALKYLSWENISHSALEEYRSIVSEP